MTLKQFIQESVDKGEYLSDQQVFKFLGEEPNWGTIEEYKREAITLKRDKDYFADLIESKNYKVEKHHRRYLIRDNAWRENEYKKISKAYYEFLTK